MVLLCMHVFMPTKTEDVIDRWTERSDFLYKNFQFFHTGTVVGKCVCKYCLVWAEYVSISVNTKKPRL